MGIAFIFLSNYFNVLAPQVTGFVIDYVQRITGPAGNASTSQANYDRLVTALTQWFNNYADNWLKVVALCGITILILALLRGFFLFLMRQTIIVMSRFIEYDQKNEVFDHYQKNVYRPRNHVSGESDYSDFSQRFLYVEKKP